MLSLGCLYVFVEWHLSWCFGWPCASLGRGLWTKATSRPVIRVPSASKCTMGREPIILHYPPHNMAQYGKKETPLTLTLNGFH